MPMHLFAYGTLMCEDIMHKVSACRPAHAPATLGNYRRGRIDGEVYPGVVAEQGGLVRGIVYFDVPAEAWARLDAFEGEMYYRCGDEISLEAETYVVRPQFVHRLLPVEWSLAEFLESGRQRFEAGYAGFEQLLPRRS
ncbi:MAG: gamma-glutamylcyclotransferase [Deltaproteobacteria bacterium]|nr:gamma-glutamylcyclotransferase [Deltaproteobacteria bacterium]